MFYWIVLKNMSKQEGRGFVNHGFSWDCWNCCCCVCTGRLCPYRKRWNNSLYRYRCAACAENNGKMTKCLQCDFFENRHTSSRRFKIKRKWRRDDTVITRLNAIIDKLGIDFKDKK